MQGPYAFSDITKLPHTAPDSSMLAAAMTKFPCPPSQASQCDEYENVQCPVRESGFVTNDIYEETCKAQGRRGRGQAGWVENEIYGWDNITDLLHLLCVDVTGSTRRSDVLCLNICVANLIKKTYKAGCVQYAFLWFIAPNEVTTDFRKKSSSHFWWNQCSLLLC